MNRSEENERRIDDNNNNDDNNKKTKWANPHHFDGRRKISNICHNILHAMEENKNGTEHFLKCSNFIAENTMSKTSNLYSR